MPGFEVVPVEVVEQAIQRPSIWPCAGPADARRLAQILSVDAVVVGAVTDYSPYYPPRMRPAGRMVRGQPEFPSHSARLWPAVGNAGGARHPGAAGFRGRIGLGQGAARRRKRRLMKRCRCRGRRLSAGRQARRRAAHRAAASGQSRRRRPGRKRRPGNRPAAGSGLPGSGCRRTGPIRAVSSRRRRAVPPPAPCPAMRRCCGTRGPTTATTWSSPRPCRATISSATTPAWGVAELFAAQRRLHPVLLPHAHLGDAQCPRRGRRNASSVALADHPINN